MLNINKNISKNCSDKYNKPLLKGHFCPGSVFTSVQVCGLIWRCRTRAPSWWRWRPRWIWPVWGRRVRDLGSMAKNGESVFMLTYLFIRKSQFVKKKKSFVGWCTLSSKQPIGLFTLEAFLVVKSVFSQRLPFLLVLSLLSLYTNLSLWMLTTMGLSNKWWVWEEVLTDACQWNNAFWFGLKSAWGNQWGN